MYLLLFTPLLSSVFTEGLSTGDLLVASEDENERGPHNCIVTEADTSDKIVIRFDPSRARLRSLKTQALSCPGKIRYELRNETSFTRIMPDGKSEAISDFLDDFRKVRGDNCKDVVKDLATYFHKNIAYETLSRFETLRYHMCYRYGDNGLRAWIRRKARLSYEETESTGVCVVQSAEDSSESIIFDRLDTSRKLSIISLQCPNGISYERSSNGIIQERTADGLRDTEDPMMSLDILSPPLDAFTCRIATVFIFNGLGVMESIEDADPYNYLKERLCHLFPQRETRVEMEGIASNTELMLPDKELGLHPGDVDGERSGESSVEVPKDKSVDARSAAELMKSPESIQTEEMTHKKEIPINASLPSRERPEFPVRVLEDELAKSRSTAELMESPERIRTKKSIRNKRKKRRHCSIC